MELVEADESPLARDASGDGGERIGLVLEARELLMHVANERVEVDARLALDPDGREERVHQEALAAADASPEVDAARNRRRRKQPLQRRAPRRTEGFEVGREPLQALEHGDLRVVERRAAR